MKIKIASSWTSSEKITRRLLDQFRTNEIDLSGIEFVHDDSYQLIVFFGYMSEPIKNGAKGYLYPQEPTWTGGHQKGFNNCENLTVFGYDAAHYNGNAKFIETFAHMFYGGIGPDNEGWDDWRYEKINDLSVNKYSNICSTVSSRGNGWDRFDDGCLYPLRCNLVKNIKHLNFIDFYGGWEADRPNIKQYALKKFDALTPYKFTLTIENSNENYYVSEKFFDPILTDSIPIYFGCKNIRKLFPENGYILLDNITDHVKIIDQLNYINQNADSIYSEMLPEARKIKNRYFTELNPLKEILSFI
jgi:hypothetical protein